MPIHLPPISRRTFLRGSAAAVGSMLLPKWSWAASPANLDPSRVALLSDIHLSADKAKLNRDVCMWDYFQKASADVLAGERLPSFALVNGDLALDAGLPGDYETILDGLKAFRTAGMPVHLNLGNHDNRDAFWKALPPAAENKPVEARHVSVLDTPAASWILLDSLEETKKTPGNIGEAQLAWLAKTLDARKDKTVIVVVHHNPQKPDLPKVSGIKDTKALLDALVPRKQVKALIFGHTHKWVHKTEEGMHLVNLPPVAYPFAKGDPSGWVDCKLADASAVLTLRAVDPKHPLHNDKLELKWR